MASDDENAVTEIKRLVDTDEARPRDVVVTHLKVDRSVYTPIGDLKIEHYPFKQPIKRRMLYDYLLDNIMLAQSHVLVGQFFSSLLDHALFSSEASEYISIDESLPCLRGGCTTPQAIGARDDINAECRIMKDWSPAVCPRMCQSSNCISDTMWNWMDAFFRNNFRCKAAYEQLQPSLSPVCLHGDGYEKSPPCFH